LLCVTYANRIKNLFTFRFGLLRFCDFYFMVFCRIMVTNLT